MLTVYQYNGKCFVDVFRMYAPFLGLTRLTKADLALTTDSHLPVMLVDSTSGSRMFKLSFLSSIFSFYQEADNKLQFCLSNMREREVERNFELLHQVFDSAPKKSQISSGGIHIEDITFANNSKLVVDSVHMEKSPKHEVLLEIEGLQTLSEEYVKDVRFLNEKMVNIS